MSNSITGYGAEYEAPVSKAKALALAGMYPLPRIGYEITVAIKPDPVYSGFRFRLHLQNIGGKFALASTNVKREDWQSIFGVTV